MYCRILVKLRSVPKPVINIFMNSFLAEQVNLYSQCDVLLVIAYATNVQNKMQRKEGTVVGVLTFRVWIKFWSN